MNVRSDSEGVRNARVFAAATCTAPADRAAGLRDLLLEHVPRDRPIDILDVGCGAGTLLFLIADALPLATLIGVDISPANIAAAEAARADHPARDRIRFVRDNYLDAALPAVDAMVSDTALHFVHGDVRRLWTKLAADLRPGGVLVCRMAYDGGYNRTIAMIRRLLRAVRSRPVEALVEGLARMVYGRSLDADGLRERTEYMYIPPEQLMSTAVKNDLAPSVGLQPIADREDRAASRTQLRQRTTVFVKR